MTITERIDAVTAIPVSRRVPAPPPPRSIKILESVLPYVDEHYWLPLYSMGDAATEKTRTLGYEAYKGNPGRYGAMRPATPCWACFTEAHVTADGKLSACCFDATGEWEMGDLTRESFLDAWNSSRFVALRKAHLDGVVAGTPCEKCLL
jgi:radical SAM protein with 4Fe4S-binding SPASM domain